MFTSKIKARIGKIPYSLKIALLIALAAKLAVFYIGYATAYSIALANGSSTEPLQLLMNMFARWDSPHYMFIAENGYVNQGDPANFIVFFPLYPLLVRLITFDFAYVNLSGLIISNVSSLVAVVYLFKLGKLDHGDSVAKKAVLYLSVFPTAYFLSAVFTESLFLALVIASLYYARKANWSFAGVLGLLAALSRLAGLLLLPVLLVEYLHQKGWKIRNVEPKLLWTSLPLLGFLVYLVINFQVTGDFFAFLEIERVHWYQTLDPLGGWLNAIGWARGGSFPDSFTIGYSQVIFAIFGFLMCFAAFLSCFRFRLRPCYFVFMLFSWLLSVSTGFWISVPRYVLAMFPIFIVLALLSSKKAVTTAITAVSLAGLCFFTWLFVTGAWTF